MSKLATSALDLYTQNNSSDAHNLGKEYNEVIAALYAIRSVAQEEHEKIKDAIADLERAMSLNEILRNGYAITWIYARVCPLTIQ